MQRMHRAIDIESRFIAPDVAVGSIEFMDFLMSIDDTLADGFTSWRSDAVVRRDGSQIEGRGLFATRDIEQGELLAIKGGRIVDEEEIRILEAEDAIHGSHQQIENNMFLVGLTPQEEDKNLIGYNHSCDPNALFAWSRKRKIYGTAFLISRRPIAAGDEVTTDYSVSHTTNTHRFVCNCQSPDCRVVIQPRYDYLHPEFQAKYKGEMPPFMQELIDDLDGEFRDKKDTILYSAFFGETVGRIRVLDEEIRRLRAAGDQGNKPRVDQLTQLLVGAEVYLLQHYPDVAKRFKIDSSTPESLTVGIVRNQRRIVEFATRMDDQLGWSVEDTEIQNPRRKITQFLRSMKLLRKLVGKAD